MIRISPRSSRRGGFTLVEILVAVAVLGIGATVFVASFSFSLALANSSRNRAVAATLAEEHLYSLAHNPGQYSWPLQPAAPGTLVEVTPALERATAPASLPVMPAARAREENLYQSFSSKAYAMLPKADANHLEVTVAVSWKEAGRGQVFTLTSCVPRSSVPTRAAGGAR